METVFTPWQSLFGGGLIGLSAVLLMLFLGRIMGATGILAGALTPTNWTDWTWRIAVILGMVTAPTLIWLVSGAMPVVQVPISTPLLLIGGFVVGIGVTFGGGCTSGHGVCGIARFSNRSIVATFAFMSATIVTVFILRHVVGI